MSATFLGGAALDAQAACDPKLAIKNATDPAIKIKPLRIKADKNKGSARDRQWFDVRSVEPTKKIQADDSRSWKFTNIRHNSMKNSDEVVFEFRVYGKNAKGNLKGVSKFQTTTSKCSDKGRYTVT